MPTVRHIHQIAGVVDYVLQGTNAAAAKAATATSRTFRRNRFLNIMATAELDSPSDHGLHAATQLVIELSRALHSYGVAAHDLEESMSDMAASLGLQAAYFATPTSIFIAFGGSSEQRTALLRVHPGDVNLEKLGELFVLQQGILNSEIGVKDGLSRLQIILSKPPRYGKFVSTVAFGLATCSAAVFFGGGVEEMMASLAIGLIIGTLACLTSSNRAAGPLLLPAASVLASMIASGLAFMSPNVTSGIVTVSSLIILIPGLGLTIAMNELATQNLASGTARLAGALSQLLIIGFGVALGRSVVALVAEPIANPAGPAMPLAWLVVSLLVASVSFTVLFQARRRDVVWITIAGFIAFFTSKYSVQYLGPLAGPSLAAATLGCLSNLLSRWRRQPVSITLVPGLLLLVPGSLGFNSIAALLDRQLINSFESAFTMVLVAAAIVSGLLFANLVVPPVRMKSQSNNALR